MRDHMTVAAAFKAATVPRIAAKPKTGMRDHMTVAAAFKAATVPRIAAKPKKPVCGTT